MHSIVIALVKFAPKAVLLVASIVMLGCASIAINEQSEKDFVDILDYRSTLNESEQELIESVFYLDEDILEMVRLKFSPFDKQRSAKQLANWLISPDGHGMTYDLSANLRPAQSFEQGRANCLSFSLLFISLARELGIELELNQVDLPDFWGEGELNNFVFYRHVNVVYSNHRRTQIFDLAMAEYRLGYPQRSISRRHGAALLFSNIGIQLMQTDNMNSALHYLKLSVSVFPQNPDLWINLGAIYKRNGDIEMAKKIYLKAFSLDDQNGLAASNLERIYRNQEQGAKARYFKKRALRARLKNPYVQYNLAHKAFDEGSLGTALKAIKKAIRLHDTDPKFYELSSRIRQVKKHYVAAVKDLHKAHELSKKPFLRGVYARKLELVVEQAKAYAIEQNKRRNRRQNSTTIDPKLIPQTPQTF